MVNDLLDLAKVEAGKIEVRPRRLQIVELFGALRGMFRPLLARRALPLVFEEPEGHPIYEPTREGRADSAQLHFQRAEVHRARRGPCGSRLADGRFRRRSRVSRHRDRHRARASRVRSSRSSPRSTIRCSDSAKGTGLGLPLSQAPRGTPGRACRGDQRTWLRIPVFANDSARSPRCAFARGRGGGQSAGRNGAPRADCRRRRGGALCRQPDCTSARRRGQRGDERPRGLGTRLPRPAQPPRRPAHAGHGRLFQLLQHLRSDPRTSATPVVVVTSSLVTEAERSRLRGADAIVSKAEFSADAIAPWLAPRAQPELQTQGG